MTENEVISGTGTAGSGNCDGNGTHTVVAITVNQTDQLCCIQYGAAPYGDDRVTAVGLDISDAFGHNGIVGIGNHIREHMVFSRNSLQQSEKFLLSIPESTTKRSQTIHAF